MTLRVAKREEGMVELWDFFEEGGPIVRCYPDGRIELFEVPQCGGVERFIGNYPTICTALKEGESWT